SRSPGSNQTRGRAGCARPLLDRLTRMGSLRPRYLTLAAADLAGAVTIVALLRPEVQFAYHAPSFHVMIETVAAMAALIAAYLVYGRFRHSRNASDLLLLAALAFLSVTKFV